MSVSLSNKICKPILFLDELKMITLSQLHVETVTKKMTLTPKYALDKKSTIFELSLWNSVRMTITWVGDIARISVKLGKNCAFFISSTFLGLCHFFVTVSIKGLLLIKQSFNWFYHWSSYVDVITKTCATFYPKILALHPL